MAAPLFKKTQEVIDPIFSQEDLSNLTSLPQLFVFSLRDFLYWWYIRMPVLYILQLQRLVVVYNDQLSISLLVRKFFVPWHRDGSFVGYFIGVVIKILYLPIAISILLIASLVFITFILFWLLVPILTVIFLSISLFIV